MGFPSPDRVPVPGLETPGRSPGFTFSREDRARRIRDSGSVDETPTAMADDRVSWQVAISLIKAWRGSGRQRSDQSAVMRRLAESTDGNAAAIEKAVLALTALGNMFLELYADCAGSSIDRVLLEAAILRLDKDPG